MFVNMVSAIYLEQSLQQQGSLSLKWINFNPCKDKLLHPIKMCGEITYPFPNFNGATVKVWDWISKFTPHFNGFVIT